MSQTKWVPFDQLEAFMADVFKALGVPEEDARTCAEVLITSDKRGIDSHGVARLSLSSIGATPGRHSRRCTTGGRRPTWLCGSTPARR